MMKLSEHIIQSVYPLDDADILVFPRKAKLLNCIIISAYGAFFFSLLCPWFNSRDTLLWIKIDVLWGFAFLSLFVLLNKRQTLYKFYSKLLKRKILLFEFGFFCTICFCYGTLVLIFPIAFGFIQIGTTQNILEVEALKHFIIFAGGATISVGALAGFDIYPTNNFVTKPSVERLIDISKSLLKTSNRVLVTAAGALIVGNMISGKTFLQLHELYATVYGIVGIAFGVSGVLGSRLSELLHLLAKIETKERYDSHRSLNKKSKKQMGTY